jgi:hypothetical protein
MGPHGADVVAVLTVVSSGGCVLQAPSGRSLVESNFSLDHSAAVLSQSWASMRTIFSSAERARLFSRIDQLTPDTPRRWGRMTVRQMVCHLTDAVESAFRPSPPERASGPLTWAPLKWLVINVLPWPKGKLESPPDLLLTQPTSWESDVRRLKHGLERVAARDPEAEWPSSDVFGELTGREWGSLLRTHLNHHLKQFGV